MSDFYPRSRLFEGRWAPALCPRARELDLREAATLFPFESRFCCWRAFHAVAPGQCSRVAGAGAVAVTGPRSPLGDWPPRICVQPLRGAFQGAVMSWVAQGLTLAVSRGAVKFSEPLSSVLCAGNDQNDRVVYLKSEGVSVGWVALAAGPERSAVRDPGCRYCCPV